jgi:glycosyltransferase involved in cell wall biosynthesis
MLVTVSVCTYNRCDLLKECLLALSRTESVDFEWEVIVVDNNSPDDTAGVVKAFIAGYPTVNCRYVLETTQGLSHGRNRSVAEAKADMMCFIDDDSLVKPGFIQRLGVLIRETDHKVIGGLFLPWYHFGKPVWYRDEFASNKLPASELTTPGGSWMATGCVMVLERALIQQLGGFDPNVGMNGGMIAYGEETFLQEGARKLGHRPVYDPKLIVDHAVLPYKLELSWFFTSHFALGRDRVIGGEVSASPLSLLKEFLIGSLVMVYDLIRSTPKLLRKDYYIQNWMIDVFRKPAKRIGTLYTGLQKMSSVK